MQFLVLPLLSAPLVSGHPQGLPGEQPDPMEQTRVKPVADARDPEARMKEGQSPTQFWSAVNGKPDPDNHTAPPSIMQITISRMLDEQNPTHKPPTEAATAEEPAPTADRKAGAGTERDRVAPAAETPSTEQQAETGSAEAPDQSPEVNEARRSVLSTLP